MWPVRKTERPPPRPFSLAAEIGAALEGAALVRAGAALVFLIKRGAVGVPEVGGEADLLQPAFQILLAQPLAGAGLRRVRHHDGGKADEVHQRAGDAVGGGLDGGGDTRFEIGHRALQR